MQAPCYSRVDRRGSHCSGTLYCVHRTVDLHCIPLLYSDTVSTLCRAPCSSEIQSGDGLTFSALRSPVLERSRLHRRRPALLHSRTVAAPACSPLLELCRRSGRLFGVSVASLRAIVRARSLARDGHGAPLAGATNMSPPKKFFPSVYTRAYAISNQTLWELQSGVCVAVSVGKTF